MTPYVRVKRSRELTAAAFPLPSVLDCIRYAITELAEYDDALLRAERTDDKRNNDKAHDPRGELGQALYMLLSAAVQVKLNTLVWDELEETRAMLYFSSVYALGVLGESILELGPKHSMMHRTPWSASYGLICALATSHGWPINALIDDTCARFEAKHAPQEVR